MELAAAYCFCPACGTKRSEFEPIRPFRCDHCGHTTFFGPVAAVGAIVTNNEGEVLLIRRAHDPAKGKLGMPGGFIDPGESAEEALRREVLEEVGLHIRNMKYLMSAPNCYAYRGIDIPVLDMFYTAQVEEGEIRTEDGEVTEWYWTRLSDEVLAEMAFASNRGALAYYRGLIDASGPSS
ncbi:MAG: NUDIX domain-containing protein [Pirellula sp.]|jgi:mutator protein MutT